MNIRYLSNLQETKKLHEEYAIMGLSTSILKDFGLERKRKKKKFSRAETYRIFKKLKEIKEWKDKVLSWPDKYHDLIFTLNKMPETRKLRRKLDRIYLYVFERKERQAHGKEA